MLKKVLLILAALVLIFIGVVASRPDHFRVERSVDIDAPADMVYAQVADFHAWRAWSPWEDLDPNLQRAYAGPSQGAGASYHWVGDEAGEGTMTVVEALPPSSVVIKLEFQKPMASVATAGFKFAPGAKGTTKTTWYMEGKNEFIGKLFCLFVDMDTMLGKEFEKGLASLDKVAEAEAQKRAAEAQKAAEAQAAANAARVAADAEAPVEPGAQPDP